MHALIVGVQATKVHRKILPLQVEAKYGHTDQSFAQMNHSFCKGLKATVPDHFRQFWLMLAIQPRSGIGALYSDIKIAHTRKNNTKNYFFSTNLSITSRFFDQFKLKLN